MQSFYKLLTGRSNSPASPNSARTPTTTVQSPNTALVSAQQHQVFAQIQQTMEQRLQELECGMEEKIEQYLIALSIKQDTRYELERRTEFLSVQIDFIKTIINEPASSSQTDLQADIDKATARLKEDYRNLVAARDRLYRNGLPVDIITKEQKEAEVSRYEQEVLKVEAKDYAALDLSQDLAKLQDQLKQNLNKAINDYDIIFQEQTKLAEDYYLMLDQLNATKANMKLNLNEFIQQQKFSSSLTTLQLICMSGDAQALGQLLPKDKKQALSYLQQEAPDAVHLACRYSHVDVLNILINQGINLGSLWIPGSYATSN